MQQPLNLGGIRPLRTGAYRSVFQHPLDDDLLVKVIKPGVIRRQQERTAWYNSWRRHGHYKALMRELEQYLVLQERGESELPFLQRFVGLVDTDIGIGMVVEKVRGGDGRLAPTLAGLVKRVGLTAPLRAGIDRLLAEVTEHQIAMCDVSATNMVLAAGRPHGDRLVIIDGIGDRLLVPIYLHSKTANAWNLMRRFRRMVHALERLDSERGKARSKPQPAAKSG